MLISVGLFAQPGTVLNFEDEYVTDSLIYHLHTEDWQTDPAYTRDLFANNPDTTGMNKTLKCASFSGFSSAENWWYGLDIVLNDSIVLNEETLYLHATLMTSTDQYDTNRGLLMGNSVDAESDQTWYYITTEWADYVYPMQEGWTDVDEFRFMFNHQANLITYLDELYIDNDSVPRTLITQDQTTSIRSNIKIIPLPFKVYSTGDNQIKVESLSENLEIEIFNVTGQLVFRKKILGNEVTIRVREKGLYIVRGNRISQKVMVY